MSTYDALAETVAEIFDPLFPDVDDVAFTNLVDGVLASVEEAFQEVDPR